MKLALWFVGVAALVVLASGGPLTKDIQVARKHASLRETRAITDANAFVDAILAAMRDQAIVLGLDPMQLPDEKHGFSVEFLFITYHGELWFTEGWLQNLSTIYRSGDSAVTVEGNTMEIKTMVKFDRLLMTYNYRAKIMNVGPIGDLIGTVDDMVLSVDLLVNLDTCVASLKDIQIKDAGRLDVRLDGSWFFDVIFNAMIDMFTWVFKNVILWLIEGKIQDAVEATLPNIDISNCSAPPRAHTHPLHVPPHPRP